MSRLFFYENPEVAATTVTNTAQTTAAGLSNIPDASVSFTAEKPQLTVSKTVGSPIYYNGETVIYTITAANTGGDPVKNIVIQDVLPSELDITTVNVTTNNPAAVVSPIGTDRKITVQLTGANALPVGESLIITISAKLSI